MQTLTIRLSKFLPKRKKKCRLLPAPPFIITMLLKENLIRKICLPNHIDCYDKILPEHDHLVCAECGRISDIVVKGVKEDIVRQLNSELLSYSLNINYICDKCKKILKD